MVLAVVLLSCAVGFLTLLVFGLLRSHAEIIRALTRAGIALDDGTQPVAHPESANPAGEVLPSSGGYAVEIIGRSPAGGHTKVSLTGAGGMTLLAFLSSGCRTCEGFWTAFADPGLRLPDDRIRLVIVGQDAIYESEAEFADLVPSGVKAVLSSAAWHDYGVPGSPYFALVDGTDGRQVGSGTAANWEQMLGILQRALDSHVRSADAGGGSSTGQDRARRADKALRSAGIGPSHPTVTADGAPGEGNGTPDRRALSEP